MPAETDAGKLAELANIIQTVKDRVRAQYPQNGGGSSDLIQVVLADLMPVLHARDAAQARVAAIGGVNPRAGGLANKIIQALKRFISRALGWFVRDQVTFNRESVSAIEAILEALNDQNRALVSIASQVNAQFAVSRQRELDIELVAKAYSERLVSDLAANLGARINERLSDLHAHTQSLHREALGTLHARVNELVATIDARSFELSAKSEFLTRELNEKLELRSLELSAKSEILARELSEKIELRTVELAARQDFNTRDLSDQIEARAREIHAKIDPLLPQLAASRTELSTQIETRAHDLSKQIDARVYELGQSFQPYLEALDPLKAEAAELKDIRKHWIEWRAGWEHKLATNEVYFLRSAAELQGAFQHRVNQLETTFSDKLKIQHTDYLGALDRANLDIQKTLWADLEKIRTDYDRLIHTELRLIRLRGIGPSTSPINLPPPVAAVALNFDYSRFAERFRGEEDYVRRSQEFYGPIFSGRENVLDIGCGRGEFLKVMRDAGVPARGIDLGHESIAQCHSRGLTAEEADLFQYLAAQPDGEFDGILSAQVIEHLDPARLPAMIQLCAAKLRRGGILAIETPNPECLAIFATHFYLDPTHTRPVPHPLLSFYMEEAGLGGLELHRLSPAVESMPEIAELPKEFQERFFGGLDYAIVAKKL